MRNGGSVSRRSFLKRTAAASLGAISARGIYTILEELSPDGPARVAAGSVSRFQEQYLIDSVTVILDGGIPVAVPPLYNDVITAKLSASQRWDKQALMIARQRLEGALARVEAPYDATAAGLTIVVGWGLPFFHSHLPASLWQKYLPVDVALSRQTGTTQYAVLDAIKFPSDPADVVLEANHVMFKLRSDSQAILAETERALFEDTENKAYIGDLFDLTSKRIGFLGRGFGSPSVMKQLALAANVPGADKIPDNAQLGLGFTSTQTAALGPDNIPSFETLPGITNQFPNGYFTSGCAMHLSHLFFDDLSNWYSLSYAERVKRVFSPHTPVPTNESTVTLPNGPGEVSSRRQIDEDATSGRLLGHNATLQQATRLPVDVIDNYGRLRPKGTAVPLREDFNTLDTPFTWSANPTADGWSPATNIPGMHFVVFVPASHRFHMARLAMDGVLPDGSNLLAQHGLSQAQNGINTVMRATHRQNYLIPPRIRRSFPLVELLS